jgi:hypothetical protein
VKARRRAEGTIPPSKKEPLFGRTATTNAVLPTVSLPFPARLSGARIKA